MRRASLVQLHQSHHPSPAAPSTQQGLKIAAAEDPFKLQAAWPSGNERRVPCLQSSNPKQIPLIFDMVTSRPWSTRTAKVCAAPAFISDTDRRARKGLRRAAVGAASVCNPPAGRPDEDITGPSIDQRQTSWQAGRQVHGVCSSVHRGMNKRVDPLRLRGTWPSPSNPSAAWLGSVRRPDASAVRTAF